MPKSSRKKKEKTADFSKAKLKLGKGKLAANNATDTSFKTRSIALPKQSISAAKDDGVPTTRRNLTLDELLTQTKHYSASVRKDALTGLRELLGEHPEVIEPSLTSILNRAVALISDEDHAVRNTLVALLGWLLPQVPSDHLVPHAPLLMLFTTSALSHIFPEIRVDAVRFLDILMDVIPDAVIIGWASSDVTRTDARKAETSAAGSSSGGRRVLDGLLALLEIKGSSPETSMSYTASNLTLSANSKLIILRALSRFLRLAVSQSFSAPSDLTPGGLADTDWFMKSSFVTESAFKAFTSSLKVPSVAGRTWTAQANTVEDFDEDYLGLGSLADADVGGVEGWPLNSFDSMLALGGGGFDTTINVLADLCIRTSPMLVSTYLDWAPSAFIPGTNSASSAALDLVGAVSDITRTLYSSVLPRIPAEHRLRSAMFDTLHTLLGHMAPYFPFDQQTISGRVSSDHPETLLQGMSLAYCELISLLRLESSGSSNRATAGGTGQKRDRFLDNEMDRVGDYVIQALQGQSTSPSHQLGKKLSSTSFSSLLPTIWSLISISSAQRTNSADVPHEDAHALPRKVLDATLEHAIRTGSLAGTKSPATDFVMRLSLIFGDTSFRAPQITLNLRALSARLVEWMLSLPRVLWELGTRDLAMTDRILIGTLRVFQRRHSFLQPADIVEFRRRLCPLLKIEHPTKGVVLASSDGPDDLQRRVEEASEGADDTRYWASLQTRP